MQQILLASNNEPITTLLRRILTPTYSVKVVTTGEDAVSEVGGCADSFSLLILDGMLPPIRGKEVIDHLCEDACPLPIILMSSQLPFDGARQAGPRVAYLPKPFHPDQLLQLVQETITSSRA